MEITLQMQFNFKLYFLRRSFANVFIFGVLRMMTNGTTTPLAIRKALVGPSGFKLLMLSRLMLSSMNKAGHIPKIEMERAIFTACSFTLCRLLFSESVTEE